MARGRDLVLALSSSMGTLQVPILQASMAARRMTGDMADTNRELAQMRANTQFAQPVVQQVRVVESGIRQMATTAAAARPRFDQMAAGMAQVQRNSAVLWGQIKAGAAAASLAITGLATAVGMVASSKLGSDIEENASLFKIVFAGAAQDAERRLTAFADAVGRNKYELKSFASEFGALLNPMGLGSKATADMSVNLAKLTTDLSSFFNKAESDVMVALRAALVGEMEPIRRLGVNLNQASLEAKALAMGLVKVGEDMTPAAKAQAAYALILEQTKQAQGDAARTSEGFANSSRNLSSSLKQIAQEIDTALLPAKTRFVQLLDRIAENFQRTQIPSIQAWLKEAVSADRVEAVFANVATRIEALAFAFGAVRNAVAPLEPTARAVFDYLSQKFQELPSWAQQLLIAGSSLGLIGRSLTAVGAMTPMLGPFIGMLGSAINPITYLSTGFTTLSASAGVLSGAIRILWSSSLGPLGWRSPGLRRQSRTSIKPTRAFASGLIGRSNRRANGACRWSRS